MGTYLQPHLKFDTLKELINSHANSYFYTLYVDNMIPLKSIEFFPICDRWYNRIQEEVIPFKVLYTTFSSAIDMHEMFYPDGKHLHVFKVKVKESFTKDVKLDSIAYNNRYYMLLKIVRSNYNKICK